MTKNEQIQEMAEIISTGCSGIKCSDCEIHENETSPCWDVKTAQNLYSKDYRKVERGEWQKCFGNDTKIRTCSNCHISQTVNVYRDKVMFMYCPYCGSDMRGATDER